MYQGRITADKVDPGGFCSTVERFCKMYGTASGAGGGQHGDRRDGNALMDDRDPVFFADVLAGFDQVPGIAADLIIDFVTSGCDVAVGAVQEGNPHRDGAHIEIFIVDHIDRFENIMGIEHVWESLLILSQKAYDHESDLKNIRFENRYI